LPVFKVLAAIKGLRESPLDIFSRSPERRLERALRDSYLAVIAKRIETLSADTLTDAIEIAKAPLDVRGFGHVKAGAAEALLARLKEQQKT
jgi:indolepyruvate ferredoxin oxidoreductase